MERMYVSVESSTQTTTDGSVFDGFEPMQSRSAIASYRCKVFRAHLEQGAASQFIVSHISPLHWPQPKNARD